MSAVYNGQTLADGDEIDAQMSAGRMLGPSPVLAEDDVAGLVLTDGWLAIVVRGGPDGVRVRVRQPGEREVRRRGLRQALRRVRQATQRSEIAEPLDMQRLILGLVREAFGEDD